MNEAQAEALSERIFTETVGGMGLLAVYLGHRLGLFKELANNGTVTVSQLAKRTQLSERYVREWLLAVATSGYVEADANGERFILSEEHAAVLADEDSPFFFGAFPGVLQGLAMAMEPLLEAFKSGGGVPYKDYGGYFREGVALSNRPMYQHEYAQKWIPAMPEIEAKQPLIIKLTFYRRFRTKKSDLNTSINTLLSCKPLIIGSNDKRILETIY